MVEILLSLVLLVAAAALALWPWVGIHDHSIDGLFLTLTGSVMFLLFLFNFIWQLRSQGAEEKLRIRNAWQHLARGISAKFSNGGKSMRTIPPRVSIAFVLGIVLLLILAFPGSLYASDLSIRKRGVSLHTTNKYWPFPYQITSGCAIVSTASVAHC